MRALWFLFALAACETSGNRTLDLASIRVVPDATLRTDTVGEGEHVRRATFVLVDAENTSPHGAIVTLGGVLAGTHGGAGGELQPQSLWIPAGETRTFALVDRSSQTQPDAAGAHVVVRAATIPAYEPPAHVDQIRQIPDDGKLVVQGVLHNDAGRPGQIEVVASFHRGDGAPSTRPFSVLRVPAHGELTVQFVSQPGAAHGTIFVGDTSY